MYKKLKRIFDGFFDGFKRSLIAFLVSFKDKNEFRKYRKKYNYKVDNDYKKKIKKYYAQYGIKINPMYHFQYSTTCNKKDVRFIPDYLYYTKIMDFYSNREFAYGVNDKNYYDLFYGNFKQPTCIFRRINGLYYSDDYKLITKKEAVGRCSKQKELIFKPSIENGSGYGIIFWKHSDNINSVIEKFKDKDFVVQKIVKQHADLSIFNPTSLNTIRVTSLIINNKVNILGATLRMGVNESRVDNACAGGIFVALNMDGTLHNVAYNHYGQRFDEHPSGLEFKDRKIPNFDKLLEKVKETHEKYGHFRLVSWDTTIDEKGEPILIESNLRNGGPFLHQYNYGPIFGNLTDQVLEEVFGRKA